MTEQKQKKDDYQKALAAFSQAMKEFHKGSFDEAASLFTSFLENFKEERELTDRARMYLALAQKSRRKEPPAPKTIEELLLAAAQKLNSASYQDAVSLLEKAQQLGEKEGQVAYLLAIAYCLMGESDMGLDFLKKAIQKDKAFSIMARNEADFEPLYEDKKFKLITRMV